MTKWDYDKLPKQVIPELSRAPIEITVLRVKMIGVPSPKMALADFITPPDEADIVSAVIKLKEIQALRLERNGKVDLEDGDLTIIGRLMVHLPIDISHSKLIVLGFVFGCFEECVKIAACLSGRNFFVTFHDARQRDRLAEYSLLVQWARPYFSDAIMRMNIFNKFLKLNARKDRRELQKWASDNNLCLKTLMEAYYVYEELKLRLSSRGFVWTDAQKRDRIHPSMYTLFLMIALCGAYYPHYFVQQPINYDFASASVGGKNPVNTVVISGFPPRYAPLYEQLLRSTLKNCIKTNATFTWK
ncbi:putative ATP-dependent RNA helicase spindle-E-like, partial [Tropilaelaps mercedesae]